MTTFWSVCAVELLRESVDEMAELNLFTERHDALSGAARRAEAEARTEKARADLTLTLTTLRLTTSSYRLAYTSPSPDH